MSYAVFTQLDYSNERSASVIHTADVGVGNIVAFNTEFDQMRNAIAGITIGTMSEEMWVGEKNSLSKITPTNELAQRETKWKVTYQGNVSKKLFTVTLPCADIVTRLLPKSDKADLAQTEMAAFVTRFNSFAKSPDDPTEAVTIIEVQLVGRNL